MLTASRLAQTHQELDRFAQIVSQLGGSGEMSPDNQPYYLCSRCIEQEDKREIKFSSSWQRSRRPTSKMAVAALRTPTRTSRLPRRFAEAECRTSHD